MAADIFVNAEGLKEPVQSKIQSQTHDYLATPATERDDIGRRPDS